SFSSQSVTYRSGGGIDTVNHALINAVTIIVMDIAALDQIPHRRGVVAFDPNRAVEIVVGSALVEIDFAIRIGEAVTPVEEEVGHARGRAIHILAFLGQVIVPTCQTTIVGALGNDHHIVAHRTTPGGVAVGGSRV